MKIKPNNLQDALSELNFSIPPLEKIYISYLEENDAILESKKLSDVLLSEWDLKELKIWFSNLGVKKENEVITIVLTSFYRKISGKNLRLSSQINLIKNC